MFILNIYLNESLALEIIPIIFHNKLQPNQKQTIFYYLILIIFRSLIINRNPSGKASICPLSKLLNEKLKLFNLKLKTPP